MPLFARLSQSQRLNRQMIMRRLYLFILFLIFPINVQAEGHLDFDDVVQTALRYAFDVRLSAIDIGISRTALQQAKSLYYPELNARFNSQYARDLTGGTPQVTAIGTTVLLQNTAYQSSFSMNASINLYDFGAREKKLLLAEKDIQVKQTTNFQSIRDTKLKVLEIYRDILLVFMELKSKKELLSLYKELALIKERLFTAGRIMKVEVVDEAIKVVKTVEAIDDLKLKLITTLQDLSFFTGKKYDPDSLVVADFRDQAIGHEDKFDIRKSFEWLIYELEIEKKQAELESLRRERYLPQFSLYSNYIFYGEDKEKVFGSLGEMQSRNYLIGLQVSLPLFDGFKSSAQLEKTKIEVERLKVEKEKKLTELMNRYDKLRETKISLINGFKNQEEVTGKMEDTLSMVWRLTEQKISDFADFLNRKVEMVLQQYELTKTLTMKKATMLELQILSEGQK